MAAQFTTVETPDLGSTLIDWYDRHHRELPWRVSPAARAAGQRPDPYKVWLSEVMLQQTTVPAVTGYYRAFLDRWPDVHALAAAPAEEVLAAWAGLGYYARARNLHRCARMVSGDLGGAFPETEETLLALPGIGPYTAAAIAAIAFDRRAVVVDANVERVMARLHAETEPLPAVKARLRALAARLTPQHRPGDHAQAVMDLGATVCMPRKPACGVCPWMRACAARRQGIAETLPLRQAKKAKPVRRGIVYAAIDPEGRVLTVRRPENGLLGGMLALPTTDWATEGPLAAPPLSADWREVGEVRHSFTHFHLTLRVMVAQVGALPEGAVALDDLEASTPTVFAKACRLVTPLRDGTAA